MPQAERAAAPRSAVSVSDAAVSQAGLALRFPCQHYAPDRRKFVTMQPVPVAALPPQPTDIRDGSTAGAWLVLGSALVWSAGGILVRLADVENPWNTIFWRASTAALFLIAFMLVRDGRSGTLALFRGMGWAGIGVGVCFATASTLFVVALNHTTVANVLLMQAGVPLLAALLSWVLFREKLRISTWIAIAAVIAGVAVMVSDSLTGKVSPVGDGLALVIALAFAAATVITRRFSHIRMTPAVCTGSLFSLAIAGIMSLLTTGGVAVGWQHAPYIALLGISMGLGMALFTQGARLIPSAFAALLGTAETILGPVWVWLFLGETPSFRTVTGGSMVLAALAAYLAWQLLGHHRIRRLPPPVN
jgi:drug/metabolite transporter (DMT)-like permease